MTERKPSRDEIAVNARLAFEQDAPCPYQPGTPEHDAWVWEYSGLVERALSRQARETRDVVRQVAGRG